MRFKPYSWNTKYYKIKCYASLINISVQTDHYDEAVLLYMFINCVDNLFLTSTRYRDYGSINIRRGT